MSYSVRIKRGAAKELARVQKPDQIHIIHAIDSSTERPLTGKPLKGADRGLRRLRVGD